MMAGFLLVIGVLITLLSSRSMENNNLSVSLENSQLFDNIMLNEDLIPLSRVHDDQKDFTYYDPRVTEDEELFGYILETDSVFGGINELKISLVDDLIIMLRKYSTGLSLRESIYESNGGGFVEDLKKIASALLQEEKLEELKFEVKFDDIMLMDSLFKIQKKWIENTISSQMYLDRLSKCIGSEDASLYQEQYLTNLQNGRHYYSNHARLSDENFVTGHMSPSDPQRSIFLHHKADMRSDYIYIYNSAEMDSFNSRSIKLLDHKEFTALHELEHQVSANQIPAQVIDILEESFSKERFWSNSSQFEKKNPDYYSDPDEILARKRVFDYELDLRNIKKYEEYFNYEHYEKVDFLFQKSFLSNNSRQFFIFFEKEELIMIMNTVP